MFNYQNKPLLLQVLYSVIKYLYYFAIIMLIQSCVWETVHQRKDFKFEYANIAFPSKVKLISEKCDIFDRITV